MALTASKVLNGSIAIDGTSSKHLLNTNYHFAKSPKSTGPFDICQGVVLGQQHDRHQFALKYSKKGPWYSYESYQNCGSCISSRGFSVRCQSRGTQSSEACDRRSVDRSDASRARRHDGDDEHPVIPKSAIHPSQGLADACQFVYNDAKYVNERARNDIVLLSRGILSLDARARQDVAILGSGFLKLDARARKDTKKIDHSVKKKAERLQHIASILKDRAQSRLKKAADKHWSNGALEADLKRADFYAKQRAMKDALMALEFVKDIHDMMVTSMYNIKEASQSGNISIEKNGETLDSFPGEVSSDRIAAIQEAYWSMASALFEADGIDYTDPDELELLVATLIDLDAMDGKISVSLLAECSSSPDVNTRKALANALSTAPSMWILGNAGMGALQRLAEDSNPTVAAAASKAIYELKKQWEIEEGDSWRFMVNQNLVERLDTEQVDDDDGADESDQV